MFMLKWFMYTMTKPQEIRPVFISSIKAAYTVNEIQDILQRTQIGNATVAKKVIGLKISGTKMNK